MSCYSIVSIAIAFLCILSAVSSEKSPVIRVYTHSFTMANKEYRENPQGDWKYYKTWKTKDDFVIDYPHKRVHTQYLLQCYLPRTRAQTSAIKGLVWFDGVLILELDLDYCDERLWGYVLVQKQEKGQHRVVVISDERCVLYRRSVSAKEVTQDITEQTSCPTGWQLGASRIGASKWRNL